MKTSAQLVAQMDLLRKLAWKELQLVDSCHDAESRLRGEAHALSLHLAGLGQVHAFDLGSALGELGGTPVSYFSSLRAQLNRARTPSQHVTQLLADYDRALRRRDLTDAVRSLLTGCRDDYQRMMRSVWVQEHAASVGFSQAA